MTRPDRCRGITQFFHECMSRRFRGQQGPTRPKTNGANKYQRHATTPFLYVPAAGKRERGSCCRGAPPPAKNNVSWLCRKKKKKNKKFKKKKRTTLCWAAWRGSGGRLTIGAGLLGNSLSVPPTMSSLMGRRGGMLACLLRTWASWDCRLTIVRGKSVAFEKEKQ